MGKPGPAPTPTAILNLRGSWRGKKRLREGEPQPPAGRPSCPRWLSPGAKQAWRELAPQLHALGLLTVLDRNALTRYCVMWDQWRECVDFIQEHGTTFPLRNRHSVVVAVKPWPQTKLMVGLTEQLGRLEHEFGMTPSARSALKVTPPKPAEKDRKQRFLCLPGERVDA